MTPPSSSRTLTLRKPAPNGAAALYAAPVVPAVQRDGQGEADGPEQALPEVGQVVHSTELLKGHKAVGIVHNGALYRLQSTKLGKLILTK